MPNALDVVRAGAPGSSATASCSAPAPSSIRRRRAAALLAGAEYIVAPTVNLDVIRLCQRYDKLVMPGAFTPTEILTAWEAGADIVKVFPADVVGPAFFKALRGPLPQIRVMPTGGVDLTRRRIPQGRGVLPGRRRPAGRTRRPSPPATSTASATWRGNTSKPSRSSWNQLSRWGG